MAENKVSCPKCGCDDVHTRYVAEGDVITDTYKHPEWMDVAENEQLRHYCRGCSYEWSTQTLEQIKKQEAKDVSDK
jgi:predicted nucleic-acid-binding Zn-ribbon protein